MNNQNSNSETGRSPFNQVENYPDEALKGGLIMVCELIRRMGAKGVYIDITTAPRIGVLFDKKGVTDKIQKLMREEGAL